MPRNPLNPKLPPKDPVTGRRRRNRNKTKQKRPAHGEHIKKLWQDPEYRAKMKARDIARREDQKRNPLKYKRSNVPDGMTKAMVRPMWARAYQLADKFIQIMKDNGQLPDEEVTVLANGDVVVSAEGVTVSTVSVPTTDTGKAEAALREAFVLAIGPTDQKIKIQAINTVLNFTKSKPEAKSKLTLDKAEDFLSMIAADNGAAQG